MKKDYVKPGIESFQLIVESQLLAQSPPVGTTTDVDDFKDGGIEGGNLADLDDEEEG